MNLVLKKTPGGRIFLADRLFLGEIYIRKVRIKGGVVGWEGGRERSVGVGGGQTPCVVNISPPLPLRPP